MTTRVDDYSSREGSRKSRLLVLYRVANVDPSGDADSLYGFNAFEIPRSSGSITLATVKRHCTALQSLHVLGTEGYHWRVRVEEEDEPNSFNDVARRVRRTWGSRKWSPRYSWWDVLDEQSPLPIVNVHLSDMGRLFQSEMEGGTAEEATTTQGRGPLLSVVAFKLLDLLQMERNSRSRSPRVTGTMARRASLRIARNSRRSLLSRDEAPLGRRFSSMDELIDCLDSDSDESVASSVCEEKLPPVGGHVVDLLGGLSGQVSDSRGTPLPDLFVTPPSPNLATEADLLGGLEEADLLGALGEANLLGAAGDADLLGATAVERDPFRPSGGADLLGISPVTNPYGANEAPPIPPTNVNFVGGSDDVSSVGGIGVEENLASPPQRSSGFDLKNDPDALNLGGATPAPSTKWDKDVFGDAAPDIMSFNPHRPRCSSVNENSSVIDSTGDELSRAEDAINEHRRLLAEKREAAAAEARVAQELEPSIKAWGQDRYGARKQLRVLLSSLEDILWEGADWTPVSIGDILEPQKCKRCFFKASLVVHPDRTLKLGPGERFLSKRIFDALSQAKTQFEEELQ